MKSSNIGGQAVMEGVMMMNKDRYSVAVRRPDGEIEVKVEQHKPLTKHKELLKVPILRGVFSFADSMIVGMSSLMYSASFYEDEEEEKKKPATKEEEEQQKAKKEKTDKLMMYGTVTFSVVIAVVLFLMVPYFLSELLHKAGAGTTLTAVAEAFVRVALFLGYLAAISRMEDIQRVFMYHGAEHKCINCVEHGLELNVKNVELCTLEDAEAQGLKIINELRVNARVAGKRLRKDVQFAIKASKSGAWHVNADGAPVCETPNGEIVLEEGEYELINSVEEKNAEEAANSVSAALPTGGFVILDTELNDDLIAEGYARDVIRAVQDARKAADLEISDRIALTLTVPADDVAKVEQFKDLIASETLATSFNVKEGGSELSVEVAKA